MIIDIIKVPNKVMSFFCKSNHSPDFAIYHSHTRVYFCFICKLSLNNIYIIPLQLLKFYIKWYFTIYSFLLLTFFVIVQHYAFETYPRWHISCCIYFCHSVNNPNLMFHSAIDGYLVDFFSFLLETVLPCMYIYIMHMCLRINV